MTVKLHYVCVPVFICFNTSDNLYESMSICLNYFYWWKKYQACYILIIIMNYHLEVSWILCSVVRGGVPHRPPPRKKIGNFFVRIFTCGQNPPVYNYCLSSMNNFVWLQLRFFFYIWNNNVCVVSFVIISIERVFILVKMLLFSIDRVTWARI